MLIFGVMFLMAFMVESLVEYFFGALFEHVSAIQKQRWLLMYIAAVVGIAGAILYGFDVIYLLGGWFDLGEFIRPSWFGMILTGLAIGRGSNYLHDLVGKFFTRDGDSGSSSGSGRTV